MAEDRKPGPSRGPLRVGLTGGLASGKSTVSRHLASLGAGVIDADAIARDLTSPGGRANPALVAAFDESILGPDGGLDRQRMRARVFASSDLRARLESVLHPMIRVESEARAAVLARGCPYLVYDIPLLAETGGASRFDRVLVVDCPVELQRARAVRRGGLSGRDADAMLAGQATRRDRLAIADDVLFNGDTIEALDTRVARLHAAYLLHAEALAGASASRA